MIMKKITILLLTAAAMASGCKRFTDINQNQNQPTTVTPNVLLSAALASSGSSVGTDFENQARWMGYWSRSGNYIADIPTESYNVATTYADGGFQDLFNTIAKYHNIQTAAAASPSTLAFYEGVAKTMTALHYSTLVDCFNNVPYSQAFNINKYITPKYDDAATIYSSLITQLDSAVYYFGIAKAYYDAGGSNTTDNQYDIMFGRGSGISANARMADWIAFANTVKLKLLMNASGVSSFSTITAAEITKAGGAFIGPGLIASVNPGYTVANAAQINPFYGTFYTNAGSPVNANYYRANTYAVKFYNGTYANSGTYTATVDTSRPQLVYTPPVAGNYDGDPASVSNALNSAIGTGLLKSPVQDQIIISDFEALFTEAEAAARGYSLGISGATAASLYKEAVEQSFIYLGSNATSADLYLAAGAVNKDPNVDYGTGGLQAILTQKWIALNGINWIQAWTDFRRSGYPVYSQSGTGIFGPSHGQSVITHSGAQGSGKYIPYRFLYPQSEYSTNGANVPTLPAAQYTPIFWDTREK
jgi:hypothetical protein